MLVRCDGASFLVHLHIITNLWYYILCSNVIQFKFLIWVRKERKGRFLLLFYIDLAALISNLNILFCYFFFIKLVTLWYDSHHVKSILSSFGLNKSYKKNLLAVSHRCKKNLRKDAFSQQVLGITIVGTIDKWSPNVIFLTCMRHLRSTVSQTTPIFLTWKPNSVYWYNMYQLDRIWWNFT